MRISLLLAILLIGTLLSAQTFRWDSEQPTTLPEEQAVITEERGVATFYPDYYEGSPTALGETYYSNLMTAAHQDLPLGTMVQVTRLDNNRSVNVRINDRGAYCEGCVISLSKAAAAELNLISTGQAEVHLKVLYAKSGEVLAQQPAPSTERFTAKSGSPTTQPDNYSTTRPKAYCPPSGNATATTTTDEEEPQLQARGIPATTVAFASEDDVTVVEAPFSPYLVQLGSYRNLPYAERHVRRMQDEGFSNVFLLKHAGTDGTILNRVIVAPFESLGDAKAYVADLDEYHKMRGLVFRSDMVEIRD